MNWIKMLPRYYTMHMESKETHRNVCCIALYNMADTDTNISGICKGARNWIFSDTLSTTWYNRPTWFKHLWEYLHSCNASVEEKTSWNYSVPRTNDFYIMDRIMEADISMETKMIFNEIRLHLKLWTASDLVALDSSNTILPWIFNGQNHRDSKWVWPDTKPFPKSG